MKKLEVMKYVRITIIVFVLATIALWFALYKVWSNGKEINRINSVIERIDMNVKIDARVFELVEGGCLKEF